VVEKLLKANKFSQQPGWGDMGLELNSIVLDDNKIDKNKIKDANNNLDPLHQKNVAPIDIGKLDALDVKDTELRKRWQRVRKWITVAPKEVSRGRATEARMTADEVAIMVNIGHAELTSEGRVRSTVNVFPHAEPFKKRRRLIKHSKAFNDFFGKEVLEKIFLLNGRALVHTVHDGRFAVCLDYSAWFDQIELADDVRDYNCFPFQGKWYRLTRLPMGMRIAVDVAHTATEIIASFIMPDGVRCDVYIDNVRFLGDNRADVIKAAATFITRSREVNATINEVPDLGEDATAAATRLVCSEGDFLGVHFDYVNKTVKVTQKTVAKLQALREVFVSGKPTYRNFLALFGLLFFSQQVMRLTPASHYYALKLYSETARSLQENPGLLESPFKCVPSRMKEVLSWVDSAIANEAVVVNRKRDPGEARYVLVTDASKRGWGAVLLDQITGQVFIRHGRWDVRWTGRGTSSWTESEAIARALHAFFGAEGPRDTIDILSDSTPAVGAFTRGYSLKYSVNNSVNKVQQEFPKLDAAFWHIDGCDNVDADALSRRGYLTWQEIHGAPERVRRLVLGLSPPTERVSLKEN